MLKARRRDRSGQKTKPASEIAQMAVPMVTSPNSNAPTGLRIATSTPDAMTRIPVIRKYQLPPSVTSLAPPMAKNSPAATRTTPRTISQSLAIVDEALVGVDMSISTPLFVMTGKTAEKQGFALDSVRQSEAGHRRSRSNERHRSGLIGRIGSVHEFQPPRPSRRVTVTGLVSPWPRYNATCVILASHKRTIPYKICWMQTLSYPMQFLTVWMKVRRWGQRSCR